MFDVGFPELIVIAVVALVVLGPERLPKAARFAGLWVRRARNQWDSVKSELERELAAEELKRNLHDAQEALRRSQDQAERGFNQLREQVRGSGQDTVADVTAAAAPEPGHMPPATRQDDDDERPRA